MDSLKFTEAHFDAFYHGRMEAEVQASFKDQLAKDPLLLQRFSHYLSEQELIRAESRAKFNAEIGPIPMPVLKARLNRSRLGLWTAAASIALLLFASLYAYQSYQFWPETASIAASVISKEQWEVNTMGSDITEIEQQELHLTKGKQLLGNQEYINAIEELEKVNRISDERYDDYILAQFYIAYAWINLKEKEAAKEVLQEIMQEPGQHYLKSDTEKLLSRLNSRFFPF